MSWMMTELLWMRFILTMILKSLLQVWSSIPCTWQTKWTCLKACWEKLFNAFLIKCMNLFRCMKFCVCSVILHTMSKCDNVCWEWTTKFHLCQHQNLGVQTDLTEREYLQPCSGWYHIQFGRNPSMFIFFDFIWMVLSTCWRLLKICLWQMTLNVNPLLMMI